jgi:PIN domain nuclease of toxin-antitoxin system
MTYLLDTHTFLWLLRAPEVLPPQVLHLCEDPAVSLALSAVTPWEMSIKTGLGKLDAAEILDDFEGVAGRGRLLIVATTIRQVTRSGQLPLHHKDPFDRLLAAQALDLDATLLSRDKVFDLYGVKRIWD